MEMLKKNMKIIISLTFFGLVSFSSYSEAGLTYEEKIKLEASSLHQELSPTEIKKRAIALKEWSSIDYFEKDIQKFIDADGISLPPENAILFIGSSSIAMWKSLEKDMHPFQVINRGFGGAHIAHVNNYLKEIVLPYRPKGIVFFCGSNDIYALKSPKEVFQDFLYFFQFIKSNLPSTKVFVIGLKPSIARDHQKEKQIKWNESVSALATQDNNLFLIDVRSVMLLENGKANPELFIEDGLHMNSKGYELWTKLVRLYLESNFKLEKS